MKKILYLFGAMALMAGMVACENGDEPGQGGTNWDEVLDRGVYVVGEATGSDELQLAWGMTGGRNEANSNELRTGMYEKYVWLEAGKPFTLVNYVEEGNQTTYTSLLENTRDGRDSETWADHPQVDIRFGELIEGGTETMSVEETGLYHIVLDLNEVKNSLGEPELAYPQIVVAPAEWGIRGGMNGWGFTKGDMTRAEDGTIVYTIKNAVCSENCEFKFAYGGGWKIQLDADGKVKANTNLGADMVIGGGNIMIEQAGIYDIVLKYKNAAGVAAQSFSYEVNYKGEIPTAMTLKYGEEDVEMIPVNGLGGQYWAVRTLEAGQTYAVTATLPSGVVDYVTIGGDNAGVTVTGTVAENGLYLIHVDYVNETATVKPAVVYGIGAAFAPAPPEVEEGEEKPHDYRWDTWAYPFTVNEDGTVTKTLEYGGALRMYVEIDREKIDWWQAEFMVYDGEIEFRGNGGDQEAVIVAAGQTVTLNFNEGTGSIQ